MEIPVSFIGIILLAGGGALAQWRRRRIFNRINECGVERFPTFVAKVKARICDGAADYFSVVFALGGLLLLAIEYQETWGWIVLLPVLALALLLTV